MLSILRLKPRCDVSIHESASMISQTAEYALQAIVDLALHRGSTRTAHEIADATNTSVTYITKILHQFTRLGVVKSQRGVGGGFTLVVDPASISVFDIVKAVDVRRRDLPGRDPQYDGGAGTGCVQEFLSETARMIEDRLRSRTIAELIDPSTMRQATTKRPQRPSRVRSELESEPNS